MKTKDQHNQNPEEVVKIQEENPSSENQSVPQDVIGDVNANDGNEEPEVSSQANEPVDAQLPVTMEEPQSSDVEVEPSGEVPATVDYAETDIAQKPAEGQTPVTLEAEVQPVIDEPVIEPVVEEPSIEEPVPAEPAIEEPVAENEVLAPEVVHTVEETVTDEVPAEKETAEAVEDNSVSDSAMVAEAESSSQDEIISAEHHEDEEGEEIDEHHEEEANKATEGFTREQIVEKLEELVKDSNVNKIKAEVSILKVAFLRLNKEFKHDEYQKLVEQTVDVEGEAPAEAPAIQDDAIEERFKAAFNIYKHNKGKYNEEQEKIKVQNLEAKTQILEDLKNLINSEETLKKTYDEFKVLQDHWKTIGMVPKNDINTLWQNYHFLVEKFFDKVKINKELKDLDLKKNLEAKMQLCEKAEELLLESSIIKSFKQLQQYHEEWKEIGPVPQDKKDELWDRFKSATEKINERRREYYSEVQDGQEQNLTAKQILCDKAEQVLSQEIDSIKGWQDASNQITEFLKIWKTIGPAPKKFNNEIWARFKSSLDGFFNAKKDYFNKLKEQQMHNYNLKLDLCLQAESLRTSADWKNTTRELINLQSEWKKIGPVPRKQSDRIWKRFRAACDEFFTTKTEYFKNIQGHEDENLKLKKELIDKVKAFEIGDDRNQAVDALKDFQRQWMDIGFIPIKEKERLQNEFRGVINKHFEKLKMDSSAFGAQNYKSKIERMSKDAPDAGRIISKERNFLLGKIQQLQEDIKLWENNIGFFAASKTANLLKTEFEKKINKAKEELASFEAKLKMLRESNQ